MGIERGKRQILSLTFALIGAAFLCLGTVAYPILAPMPEATVVIDSSAPVVSSTRPRDGATYQYLAVINVYCRDPDSGIAWVHYEDSSPEQLGKQIALNYKLMMGGDEAWESDSTEIPPGFPEWQNFDGVYTPGVYSFQYEVSNDNAEGSLTTVVSGQYTIYEPLEGTWYINDRLISAQTQQLHFNTTTLTFRFERGAGSGTVIGASVTWSEGSLDMIETITDIWEVSYVFSDGTYILELSATDGTTDVIMSVLTIDFGNGGIEIPLQVILVGAGCSFMVASAATYPFSASTSFSLKKPKNMRKVAMLIIAIGLVIISASILLLNDDHAREQAYVDWFAEWAAGWEANFGSSNPEYDLSGNGIVGAEDFGIAISSYAPPPSPEWHSYLLYGGVGVAIFGFYIYKRN